MWQPYPVILPLHWFCRVRRDVQWYELPLGGTWLRPRRPLRSPRVPVRPREPDHAPVRTGQEWCEGKWCWTEHWILDAKDGFEFRAVNKYALVRFYKSHKPDIGISPLPSFIFFMKGLSFFSYKIAPSVCLWRKVTHVCSRREIWNNERHDKKKNIWCQLWWIFCANNADL